MATIDQPTPSNPKSPTRDPQPLQPGGPQESRINAPDPKRPNPQPPEGTKDKIDDRR